MRNTAGTSRHSVRGGAPLYSRRHGEPEADVSVTVGAPRTFALATPDATWPVVVVSALTGPQLWADQRPRRHVGTTPLPTVAGTLAHKGVCRARGRRGQEGQRR